MSDPTNAQLAAEWLSTAKWAQHRYENMGPAIDFRMLTRKVGDVPRDLLDAMLALLATAGTSYTGSLAEGKDYAGTWYTGHVWWSREESRDNQDNTFTIWQVLVCGDGSAVTFVLPGASGTVTQTLFWGKTKAAVDALFQALSAGNHNHSSPNYSEETGRWSGVIVSSPADNTTTNATFAKTGPLVEFRAGVDRVGGVDYLTVDAVQYTVRAGYLLTSAYAFYEGGLEGQYGAFLTTDTHTGYWYFKRVCRVDRQVWVITRTSVDNQDPANNATYVLLQQYNLFKAKGAPWGTDTTNEFSMPVRTGTLNPGQVWWPDPDSSAPAP